MPSSGPVVVTGATGLLGRAVVLNLRSRSIPYIALGRTRATGDIRALDLSDTSAVTALFAEDKPSVVIHCAAERRPDVAQREPQATRALNVGVPEVLAQLCKTHEAAMLYVSTDYVFDGSAPSGGYDVDAKPRPLQDYGVTKLAGEEAMLSVLGDGKGAVLRVPVLYGEADSNSESAVNVLVNGVRDASKPAKNDHWARRFPTNVHDVARVLVDLSVRLKDGVSLPSHLHFSAQEEFSKLDMARLFAKLLGVSSDHLVAVSDEPGPGETPRPRDCHLSTAALEKLGIDVNPAQGFESWWAQYFGRGGGQKA